MKIQLLLLATLLGAAYAQTIDTSAIETLYPGIGCANDCNQLGTCLDRPISFDYDLITVPIIDRGLNILVVDTTDGSVLADAHFDTIFGNSSHTVAQMEAAVVDFIAALPANCMIAIAVMDSAINIGPSGLGAPLVGALESLGSTLASSIGLRESWAMIATLPASTVTEEKSPDAGPSVTIEATVSTAVGDMNVVAMSSGYRSSPVPNFASVSISGIGSERRCACDSGALPDVTDGCIANSACTAPLNASGALSTANPPEVVTATSTDAADQAHLFSFVTDTSVSPAVTNLRVAYKTPTVTDRKWSIGNFIHDESTTNPETTTYLHSEHWTKTAAGCIEHNTFSAKWQDLVKDSSTSGPYANEGFDEGEEVTTGTDAGKQVYRSYLIVREKELASTFRGTPIYRYMTNSFPLAVKLVTSITVSDNVNVFAPVNVLAAITEYEILPTSATTVSVKVVIRTQTQAPFFLRSRINTANSATYTHTYGAAPTGDFLILPSANKFQVPAAPAQPPTLTLFNDGTCSHGYTPPAPGLLAGSLSDPLDAWRDAPNPGNLGSSAVGPEGAIFAGLMGNVRDNHWLSLGGAPRALIYSGQIYLAPGEWTFIENMDDQTVLNIDGVTIIDDLSWQSLGQGVFNATVDDGSGGAWYDFDVRFADFGGPYGFWNRDVSNWGQIGNSDDDPDGIAGFRFAQGNINDDPLNYMDALDPGDGSLFRHFVAASPDDFNAGLPLCDQFWTIGFDLDTTDGVTNCELDGSYKLYVRARCRDDHNCPIVDQGGVESVAYEGEITATLDTSNFCADMSIDVGLEGDLTSYEDALRATERDDFFLDTEIFFRARLWSTEVDISVVDATLTALTVSGPFSGAGASRSLFPLVPDANNVACGMTDNWGLLLPEGATQNAPATIVAGADTYTGVQFDFSFTAKPDQDVEGSESGIEPSVILYQHDSYGGGSVEVTGDVANLAGMSFDNTMTSFRIVSGTWEFCEGAAYSPPCFVASTSIENLVTTDPLFNDRISSVRLISTDEGLASIPANVDCGMTISTDENKLLTTSATFSVSYSGGPAKRTTHLTIGAGEEASLLSVARQAAAGSSSTSGQTAAQFVVSVPRGEDNTQTPGAINTGGSKDSAPTLSSFLF